MKLLAIAILSHNRPYYLAQLLKSLAGFYSNKSNITIYVLDNSEEAFVDKISEICSSYSSVELKHEANISQVANIKRVLDLIPHEYVQIVHDDDALYVSSVDSLIKELNGLRGGSYIPYLKSLIINDAQLSIRVHPKKHFQSYLYKELYPYNIPVFPSWLYPWELLKTNGFRELMTKRCGKYSDILFIDDLLRQNDSSVYLPVKLESCCYLYRIHSFQDSCAMDLINYIKARIFVKDFSGCMLRCFLIMDIVKQLIILVKIKLKSGVL